MPSTHPPWSGRIQESPEMNSDHHNAVIISLIIKSMKIKGWDGGLIFKMYGFSGIDPRLALVSSRRDLDARKLSRDVPR